MKELAKECICIPMDTDNIVLKAKGGGGGYEWRRAKEGRMGTSAIVLILKIFNNKRTQSMCPALSRVLNDL